MPVDRASYRGWEGTAQPSPRAIWAIAGTMIARRMKLKMVRNLTGVSVFLAIMMSAGWFFITSLEGTPFSLLFNANPDADHLVVANRIVFDRLLFLAMVLIAIVGAPMIAEDRRAKALRLYFSRPITHLEYVLGKFLAVAGFAAVILVVPALAMYLVELALTSKEGLATSRLPTLLWSLVPAVLGCFVFTLVVLGISALCERTNQAAIGYFAVFGLTGMFGGMFSEIFDDDTWLAISPWSSLERVMASVLPMPELSLPFADGSSGPGSGLPILPGDPTWGVGLAWVSIAVWLGLGLGALIWRIRNVEVVT